MIPGKKYIVTVDRRIEGARNAAGEPTESWVATTNGTDIKVHIQPLRSPSGGATAREMATVGRTMTSTKLILLPPETSIEVGDRVIDADGNKFVVQSVDPYPNHIEVAAAISDEQ